MRRSIPALVTLLSILSLAVAAPAHAQSGRVGGPQVDRPLSAAERTMVLDSLTVRLVDSYIFEEKGKAMADAISRHRRRGDYDKITSSIELADSLTSHIFAVSHDKHLRVRYSEEVIPDRGSGPGGGPTPEEIAAQRHDWQVRNFGFEKVERMMGNVGYLDLRGFAEPGLGAGETATAAMNFLANCDALIIDLRKNGGGTPEMIQLLATYLYDEGERVHLNDLYQRRGNVTEQYWTLPHVSGPRLGGKDVYILTSARTFSAAEEFTYDLKNVKRATVVGETTGGGAHPVNPFRLSDHFEFWCSIARAVSPVTGTNWEGTGVTPDVACPADQALDRAHVMAIEKLLEKAPESEKERLRMALDKVKADIAAAANGLPAPPPDAGSPKIVIKQN